MFLGHLVRELKRERTMRGPKSVSKEGMESQTAASVGSSRHGSRVPVVAGIPYIDGWPVVGTVMLGSDMGSAVGGEVARTIKGC